MTYIQQNTTARQRRFGGLTGVWHKLGDFLAEGPDLETEELGRPKYAVRIAALARHVHQALIGNVFQVRVKVFIVDDSFVVVVQTGY